jgi:hypothetical protein
MNTGPGRVAGTGQRRPAEVTLAGWTLLLAPLLLLTGEALHPLRSAQPAQQLAIVAGHSGMWYASHMLLFVGAAG